MTLHCHVNASILNGRVASSDDRHLKPSLANPINSGTRFLAPGSSRLTPFVARPRLVLRMRAPHPEAQKHGIVLGEGPLDVLLEPNIPDALGTGRERRLEGTQDRFGGG